MISRELSVGSASESADMDVNATAEHIVRGGYRRVALQFPDAELAHAEQVFQQLQAAVRALEARRDAESANDGVPSDESPTGAAELFVLADTSFDGYQLDFVAAQHVCADLVIHYGDADLEAEGPIDARFVFGRRTVDASRTPSLPNHTGSTRPDWCLRPNDASPRSQASPLSSPTASVPSSRSSWCQPSRTPTPLK